MASKKKSTKDKPEATPSPGVGELPLGNTPGVAPLVIAALAKAVGEYENANNKRCQASPGEIAAKRDLALLLHKHKAELPTTKSGASFYRHDERDYVLEEKMKIRAAGAEDGDDE